MNKLQELIETLGKFEPHYEEVKLPSCNNYGGNLEGGIVHVRAMTGHEEQIMATPKYRRNNVAINLVLEKCVKEFGKKFKSKDLLPEDFNFLLIYLSGISYGVDLKPEITCPYCNHKFTTTINLDTLSVTHHDQNPEKWGVEHEVFVVCPKDAAEFEIDIIPYLFSIYIERYKSGGYK